MSENRRGSQDGASNENSAQEYNKSRASRHQQAPDGFEGMNYEQKRGPYRGGSPSNRSNNNDDNKSPAKRRDEL